jgi:pimeloyl-ACP methyl ester carboxylesterase
MRNFVLLAFTLAALSTPTAAQIVSTQPPPSIATEPSRNPAHPARMEVVHIPTGGVQVNGVVLVPAGAGAHPTVILLHGLPGNERNLDLAQALRRAGFTVLAPNYRGSWGSPGAFRFAQNLEDARAFLAFVRSPANARLGFDPARLLLVGHSMGGWVTAETLADDPKLLGGITISAGDFGALGQLANKDPKAVAALMDDNRESLAGVTGASMATEVASHADAWSFAKLAPRLRNRRLLVLYSNDFVRADSEHLVADVKASGGTEIQSYFVDTDHSWSDRRLTLEALVINWASSLIAVPTP